VPLRLGLPRRHEHRREWGSRANTAVGVSPKTFLLLQQVCMKAWEVLKTFNCSRTAETRLSSPFTEHLGISLPTQQMVQMLCCTVAGVSCCGAHIWGVTITIRPPNMVVPRICGWYDVMTEGGWRCLGTVVPMDEAHLCAAHTVAGAFELEWYELPLDLCTDVLRAKQCLLTVLC
jgi:hypothetical protein